MWGRPTDKFNTATTCIRELNKKSAEAGWTGLGAFLEVMLTGVVKWGLVFFC
jgi:hypothetical protein